MLNFNAPTVLTPGQISLLQRLEAHLGRLIRYSGFRKELHHKLYNYRDAIHEFTSFEVMANDLLERILYVNRYQGDSRPKRVPSEISKESALIDDALNESFKRLCIRKPSAKREQPEVSSSSPVPSSSSANNEPGTESARSKRFRR